MEPRLRRSQTEIVIAGVCGGLAEYFAIDPVIVRLIFVLMTLTTGIGALVYPLLWIVMPKAGPPVRGAPVFPPPAQDWRRPSAALEQQPGREEREVLLREQLQPAMSRPAAQPLAGEAPPPEAYNFDPLTGQPLRPDSAMTGRTVNLGLDPAQLPALLPPAEADSRSQRPIAYGPPAPVAPRKRWRSLGIVMLGVGVLALASQLNINFDLVFALLLLGAGFLLLRRRSH